jgi:CheY-like chemotaxis protein
MGTVAPSSAGILVVEDETMLLLVIGETLREAGFEVWEASDGEAALEILNGQPGIELLITDIKMPGMNGYQVADASLRLRPGLKVLFMTGYAQEPIPLTVKQAGIPVLYKPFDFNKLPQIASQLVEGSTPPS